MYMITLSRRRESSCPPVLSPPPFPHSARPLFCDLVQTRKGRGLVARRPTKGNRKVVDGKEETKMRHAFHTKQKRKTRRTEGDVMASVRRPLGETGTGTRDRERSGQKEEVDKQVQRSRKRTGTHVTSQSSPCWITSVVNEGGEMKAREGQNSDDARFCAENTRGAKKNKKRPAALRTIPSKRTRKRESTTECADNVVTRMETDALHRTSEQEAQRRGIEMRPYKHIGRSNKSREPLCHTVHDDTCWGARGGKRRATYLKRSGQA